MEPKRPLRRKRATQAGVTLFFALFVLLLLSGIAASMALRTLTENRANASYRNIAQSYHSALAGLEEGRSRLMLSGPGAIPGSSLPTTANKVLYIVNSTFADPVAPTDPASPYFDSEYLREFPAPTTVELLASNQPNAQTAFAIPYKWVRITLKTEYSSQQDVNQDGILDDVTPLVFDGSHQELATATPGGWLVYKVTALAVQPAGTRRLLQYEVASRSWITPPAAVSAGANVELKGGTTVSGFDNCAAAAALYGIVSAGDVKLTGGAKAVGQPDRYLANTSLPSPSPTELLTQMAPFAVPILAADPSNVTYDEAKATYYGSWVVLGDLTAFPPSPQQPAVPALVYADHSLSIDAGEGAGILLVEGDLKIKGKFQYYGLIVATGAVDIQADNKGNPAQIHGAIFHGGPHVAASAKAGGVDVLYDSCALSLSADMLPKTILAFKILRP